MFILGFHLKQFDRIRIHFSPSKDNVHTRDWRRQIWDNVLKASNKRKGYSVILVVVQDVLVFSSKIKFPHTGYQREAGQPGEIIETNDIGRWLVPVNIPGKAGGRGWIPMPGAGSRRSGHGYQVSQSPLQTWANFPSSTCWFVGQNLPRPFFVW